MSRGIKITQNYSTNEKASTISQKNPFNTDIFSSTPNRSEELKQNNTNDTKEVNSHHQYIRPRIVMIPSIIVGRISFIFLRYAKRMCVLSL